MNVRPLSSRRSRKLLVSRIAMSIRSESRRCFRKSFQFLPNENCLSDTLQPPHGASTQHEREDVVRVVGSIFGRARRRGRERRSTENRGSTGSLRKCIPVRAVFSGYLL